tara:strand:- start:248 stop:1324 length:1077 start_codon:yes stop_codon:yes gene_type:complete
MKYTVKSIQSKKVVLAPLTKGNPLTKDNTWKHFEKAKKALKEQLILNINPSGRVTTTKTGAKEAYKGQTPTKKRRFNPAKALTTMAELNIDADSLKPIETGTVFDQFMSNEGGFLPGTNIMAAGAPGVGKTTVLLELLEGAQKNGHKVLFISAEMNKMDMARYMKRFPNWKDLPILFLNEFADECPQCVVEEVIHQGWDLILTDSYTEVNDTVKEACNLTRSKTEKWFLDLMIKNNEGKNKTKTFTTFITILQLSKGGTFVGSNKLKHMTSAMMDINWEGGENSGERYMEFTKNRCGMVGQKLYYKLAEGVKLDKERYLKELEYGQILQNNQEADWDWDQVFAKEDEEVTQGPESLEI